MTNGQRIANAKGFEALSYTVIKGPHKGSMEIQYKDTIIDRVNLNGRAPFTVLLEWLNKEEFRKPKLTDGEKKYINDFIKPFANPYQIYVEKRPEDNNMACLLITIVNESNRGINSAYTFSFIQDHLFTGLVENIRYSGSQLGL